MKHPQTYPLYETTQHFVLINKWCLRVQSVLPTICLYPQSGYDHLFDDVIFDLSMKTEYCAFTWEERQGVESLFLVCCRLFWKTKLWLVDWSCDPNSKWSTSANVVFPKWLILIYLISDDWCWLVLIGVDWCWLVLIGDDWLVLKTFKFCRFCLILCWIHLRPLFDLTSF